jgi:hypothetical protein
MSKTVVEKLTNVVDAVRDLPEDTQETLVNDLEDRVADATMSNPSDVQRDEIKRRLATRKPSRAPDCGRTTQTPALPLPLRRNCV